jgi:hypothetical protein
MAGKNSPRLLASQNTGGVHMHRTRNGGEGNAVLIALHRRRLIDDVPCSVPLRSQVRLAFSAGQLS